MTAEDRGFYFAVFISDSSKDSVRAWFDGSEDYSLFSHKEFVELAFDIEPSMRRALMDYSYFLWDVRNKQINRLRFQQDPEAIRKMLNEHKPEVKEGEENTISEHYYRNDTKINVDKVSIKT